MAKGWIWHKAPVDGAPQESVVETLPSVAVIITDLNRELIKTQPQLYEKVISRMLLGRLGELDDVAGPLVFLASPAAKFVTGQTLYVDGGNAAG